MLKPTPPGLKGLQCGTDTLANMGFIQTPQSTQTSQQEKCDFTLSTLFTSRKGNYAVEIYITGLLAFFLLNKIQSYILKRTSWW